MLSYESPLLKSALIVMVLSHPTARTHAPVRGMPHARD